MPPDPLTAGQPPASCITSSELAERYGDRWQIASEAPGVWSAEHRSPDGRHIRVLVGRSVPELAGKLEAAETAGP